MTSEVSWVLDTIKANFSYPSIGYGEGGYGSPTYGGNAFEDTELTRVDRDESELLEGNIRKRKGDLQDSNFVGATHADTATDAVGTEYDHRIEVVVGVRIEGMTAQGGQFGHVDPTDVDGIPWSGLVESIRRGLLQEREYPTVGANHRVYTDLLVTNEAPQSDRYRDYYRHDVDVVLRGYEELP